MEIFVTWIHIVFFSAWLGANFFCLAVFLPASTSMPPAARDTARSRAARGLNRVVAVAAPPVLVSDLAPLFSPALGGWSGVEFVLMLAMLVNHALQAFRYGPDAARGRDGSPVRDEGAWQTWVRLLALNVALGLVTFFLGLSLA